MLRPLLKSGIRAERDQLKLATVEESKKVERSFRTIGQDAKMPWQIDGRDWHLNERRDREGKPCRWEGKALEFVLDSLAEMESFAEPNFNHRGIVEVKNRKKTGGWFLHAHTGHRWWLKLVFRVKKGTFNAASLQAQFSLPPADDLDLPVYGQEPRLTVFDIRGPWQEIVFKIHWKREIDVPAFREFLEKAQAAHQEQALPEKMSIQDLEPWKVLGKKWHLSEKGIKSATWRPAALEALIAQLEQAFEDLKWDWKKKTVVTAWREGRSTPLFNIHTKRPRGLDFELFTSPGDIALGRIAQIGTERTITNHRHGESVQIRFTRIKEVNSAEFVSLLKEIAK